MKILLLNICIYGVYKRKSNKHCTLSIDYSDRSNDGNIPHDERLRLFHVFLHQYLFLVELRRPQN